MAQMPTPGQSVSVSASASVDPSSNYKLKDADGIVLDHQLHRQISLSTAIGYNLPMRDKVIEKSHHTTLMNLSRRPTPFARVKVSCRM